MANWRPLSNKRLLAHLLIAPLYDIMFALDALANKHPLSMKIISKITRN